MRTVLAGVAANLRMGESQNKDFVEGITSGHLGLYELLVLPNAGK